MKLNRAWPEQTSEKPKTKLQTEKVDARVWPKSITNVVDETVERSLSQLLKESFPEESLDDPKPVAEATEAKTEAKTEALFVRDPMTNVWIAFAILAFMTFAAVNSLYQKISSLESWLHGRMMSTH